MKRKVTNGLTNDFFFEFDRLDEYFNFKVQYRQHKPLKMY